jgi:LPXTG-motif cell wall-anchored protein
MEGERHEHHDATMSNNGNHDNDGNELSSNASDRDESNANRSDENREELPRTASRQPLLLGAGLAALALGLVVAFARRRRTV